MIEYTSQPLSKKLTPILKREWIEGLFYYRGVLCNPASDRCVWPKDGEEYFPAFTACELMKALPDYLTGKDGDPHNLFLLKYGYEWSVSYDNVDGFPKSGRFFLDLNPAEALGQMVVWLHGEGGIE